MKALVPIEIVEGKILFIRGQKVMLDRDLAQLYGVETRVPLHKLLVSSLSSKITPSLQ